jgi:hypothetical protein
MTQVSRVKAFSLSGSGRVSRFRVARLSRLAGLRSDKAKTSPRLVLALFLSPGWVSWVNWFRSARSGLAGLGLYPLSRIGLTFRV